MSKKLIAAVLVSISLSGVLSAAQADQNIAVIIAAGPGTTVQGVQAQLGGSVALRANLVTAADANAQLRFTDGGVLFVAPETDLTVLDYSFDPRAPELGHAELPLSDGQIRLITGAIPKKAPGQLVVKTNYGEFAAIGTDFTVIVCGSICSARTGAAPGAYLKVASGGVMAKSMTGNSLLVQAGQSASMSTVEVRLIGRLPPQIPDRTSPQSADADTSITTPLSDKPTTTTITVPVPRVEPAQTPASPS